MFDVIIIGKGPAGISAGIYTSMASLKTLVIGKESTIEKANSIKNYFGFAQTINGVDLIKNGINQAKSVGCDILDDLVIKLEKKGDIFEITTNSNVIYDTKAVLLATGNTRNIVNIENIEVFEGKGVSYCIACDGFFFKNKKVAVLGNTNYTISEADELLNYTQNVYILTNGKPLEATVRSGIDVNTSKIKEIGGNHKLEYIMYEDGTKESFDGLFIAESYPKTSDFVQKLGIETKQNLIKINNEYMTNISGLFAAGDLVNEFKQIATAVSSGAIAGKNIIKYCKESKNIV